MPVGLFRTFSEWQQIDELTYQRGDAVLGRIMTLVAERQLAREKYVELLSRDGIDSSMDRKDRDGLAFALRPWLADLGFDRIAVYDSAGSLFLELGGSD